MINVHTLPNAHPLGKELKDLCVSLGFRAISVTPSPKSAGSIADELRHAIAMLTVYRHHKCTGDATYCKIVVDE